MNRERTPRSNDRFSRTRSGSAPRYSGGGGERRAAGFGGGPKRSGGSGGSGRSGGYGRRSASGVKGEFALPVTVTPPHPPPQTLRVQEM
ncbi:ATP-dependent helicase, partial [Streptomyces anulatus]